MFENSEDNSYIGKYVKGNTGFEAEVDKYLVVTADRACFYNAMEINQEYIDGAIFGTVLTYALHFMVLLPAYYKTDRIIKQQMH